MKLHTHPEEFRELITVVANEKHISESAVERDYYIVMMLKSLADSPYADQCVFKGGTSLSKCYPGSIDRFSEDIDLTFLGMELSDKACDKTIKKIETIMAAGAQTEKIVEERSNRSKSMYVWFGNPENRVKLEIGSTVRPDPYQKMPVKTCIQEFLESRGFTDDIERFELETVEINTLNIERTFIDKIMSVKRHAICGTLNRKVRHIYDVTRLYQMPEIQAFLAETDELKRLVRLTKDTDSYYIGKRNISAEYDPTGAYDFDGWQKYFDADIRITYETLHTTLLYTDEKQDFDVAVNTFKQINGRLTEIGEYAANNYDGQAFAPKAQYYRHADGRDDGLKKIDPDSAEAFADWLENREKGGHPWEVCRGGNSTHVSLYVGLGRVAEGCYHLALAAKSYGRCVEAIKFYLALKHAGLPVIIYGAEFIKKRLLGLERVGIVPNEVMPFYCHSRFPGEDVDSFRHLNHENPDAEIALIEWQPIKPVKLKENAHE